MVAEIRPAQGVPPTDSRWLFPGRQLPFLGLGRETQQLLDTSVVLKDYKPQEFITQYKGDGYGLDDLFRKINGSADDFVKNVSELKYEMSEEDNDGNPVSTVGKLRECLILHHGQLHEDIMINGVAGVISTIQRIKTITFWIGETNIQSLKDGGLLDYELGVEDQVDALREGLLVDFENRVDQLLDSEGHLGYDYETDKEFSSSSPIVDSDILDELKKLKELSEGLNRAKMVLVGDI